MLLSGEPSSSLLDLAGTEAAEAIVVGSLGPDSIRPMLGTSVGAELLRDAPCTVVELGRR